MQLGLNIGNFVRPEDWPLIEDLGVQWIKTSVGVEDPEDADRLLRQAEDYAAHGCCTVVDVRTDPIRLGKTYNRFFEALQAGDATTQERAQRAWLESMSGIGESVHALVERCGHLVKDWEIEGEFTCPVVTKEVFSQHDYTLHLAACADAIRQADPGARVWTGGSGVNLQVHWLRQLLEEVAGTLLVCELERDILPEEREQAKKDLEAWYAAHGLDPSELKIEDSTWHERQRLTPEQLQARQASGWRLREEPWEERRWFPEGMASRFDVINWHHYGHTASVDIEDYGLAAQLAAYEAVFDEADALDGGRHWVASSEWGLPVSNEAALFWAMFSSAVQNSPVVLGIPEAHIGEWYEQCLSLFARRGFRVLCIHHLRETRNAQWEVGFWGEHCGLLDVDGKRRDSFDVVQRWAWEARRSGVEAFEITVEDNTNGQSPQDTVVQPA